MLLRFTLCKYSIKSIDCQGVKSISLYNSLKKPLVLNQFKTKKTDLPVNINQLDVNKNQLINQFINQLINNWFLYAVFVFSLVIARVCVICVNSLLVCVNLIKTELTNSLGFFSWFFFFLLSLEGKDFVFDLGGLFALSFPGVFEQVRPLYIIKSILLNSITLNVINVIRGTYG